MADNKLKSMLMGSTSAMGWLAVLVTLAVWSSFSLISRYGLVNQLTPWDLIAIRCGVSGVIALPILWWRRELNLIFSQQIFKLALSGGLGYVIFVFLGFTLAPTAHSAIWLYGAIPFWTVLLSLLLLKQVATRDEKISLLCLMVGIAGLLYLNVQRNIPFNWGDLCFLIAAAFWGYFSILLKQYSVSLLVLVGGMSFYGSLFYLPIYLLWLTKKIALLAWSDLLFAGFFHGIVVLFVALWCYQQAIHYLGATKSNTILALAPFIAALLAVPLLHEALGMDTMIGLSAVACAVFQPWKWLRSG